jgi:hypothetical protein
VALSLEEIFVASKPGEGKSVNGEMGNQRRQASRLPSVHARGTHTQQRPLRGRGRRDARPTLEL